MPDVISRADWRQPRKWLFLIWKQQQNNSKSRVRRLKRGYSSTMGLTAYQPTNKTTLNCILIKDDDPIYFTKVKTMLDALYAVILGQSLLTEINSTGKKVVIAPTASPVDGNKCSSEGDAKFYTLVAAFRAADNIAVQKELGHALMGAAAAGWTLQRIGITLAGGLSPVTARTIHNLGSATTMTSGARQMVGARIADLIEAVADARSGVGILSHKPSGEHSVLDELARFLRPWLTAGKGQGSRINFNPDGLRSCMGDQMVKRPPEIGLAHELCHAWRNAKGERLFDDANSCGFFDDEVMTTGFPPYQYERFNENMFRAAWGVPLRENYR